MSCETDERADAFTRIVESIDHHLYINEVLPDGGRRTLFSGPGRDRLLGGVPPTVTGAAPGSPPSTRTIASCTRSTPRAT